MNSFIFLPCLLSIEPGSGIIADRNHRERERKRQVYSCIFVRACRVFRISEWSRPAMPAGPRYSIYSAPIKNESKISLPPSLPPSHSGSGQRSFNARTAENMSRVTASFTILTASEVALSGAALQGWYHLVNLVRGNGYFRAALWKNYFFPPTGATRRRGRENIREGEREREREECVVFELRLRAKEVRKRGWATPRIFSFFFFFPLFERGANRVSTSVLVHAHAVTNGHDRYPYLNTGRKY